ncbi:MAG: metallophosphoesterase [bacterium]
MTPPTYQLSRRTLLAGLGLLAAGCSSNLATEPDKYLATPPAVPRNTSFLGWVNGLAPGLSNYRFIVMGDNRPSTTQFTKTVALANSLNPLFTVHVGDEVQVGTTAEWNLVAPVLDQFTHPVVSVPGNHELNASAPGTASLLWAQYWGVREWSFRCGPWHFVGLDSSSSILTASQFTWLDQQLNDRGPTIVFMHHPPSVAPWNVSALSSGTTNLLNRLAAWNVEMLFAGHIHRFHQMKIGKTLATVTGGAGSGIDTAWSFGQGLYHLMVVDVTGYSAKVTMVPVT